MSVYSTYYLVDWETLAEGYAAAEVGQEFLGEGMDEAADWIKLADFGDHSDEEYYTSWRMLLLSSDWLHDVKECFQQAKILVPLLRDLGLVTQDESFVPIQKLTDEEDEWVLGAMPPEDVAALHEKAHALELDTLRTDANAALAEEECEVFSGADDFVDFIRGLRHLLDKAVEQGRGLLIVAG